MSDADRFVSTWSVTVQVGSESEKFAVNLMRDGTMNVFDADGKPVEDKIKAELARVHLRNRFPERETTGSERVVTAYFGSTTESKAFKMYLWPKSHTGMKEELRDDYSVPARRVWFNVTNPFQAKPDTTEPS